MTSSGIGRRNAFRAGLCRARHDSRVKNVLCILIICLSGLPTPGQTVLSAKVHRLALADCDDVAFGPDDDLYFACHSPSDNLPVTVHGSKSVSDEMDGYVIRLKAQTGTIVFATRLGGSAFDAALRIAVDIRGHAYATGLTKSSDFPVTGNAHQRSLNGGSDAFFVELAPDGEMIYSSLIGGAREERGNGMVIDRRGTVYLGGITSSSDFPGRYAATKLGADDNAFVCRVEKVHDAWSCSVFGGGKDELLTGIALDDKGGIFASGSTNSPDFPVKDPIQDELSGQTDVFLTRLFIPSLDVTFSSFFGGSGDDTGWGIAFDKRGRVVLAGTTNSEDIAGTARSAQPRKGGGKDAFVSVLEGRHWDKIRTTHFGGSADDESGYDGSDIKVDRDGNIWLVGTSYSNDLPTRNGYQPRFGGGNGDGFVAAFDRNLQRLCYATFFGDRDRNLLEGLAISVSGLVAATGVSFADPPAGSSELRPVHNVFVFPGTGVCEK